MLKFLGNEGRCGWFFSRDRCRGKTKVNFHTSVFLNFSKWKVDLKPREYIGTFVLFLKYDFLATFRKGKCLGGRVKVNIHSSVPQPLLSWPTPSIDHRKSVVRKQSFSLITDSDSLKWKHDWRHYHGFIAFPSQTYVLLHLEGFIQENFLNRNKQESKVV